jgi:hypothetical protein
MLFRSCCAYRRLFPLQLFLIPIATDSFVLNEPSLAKSVGSLSPSSRIASSSSSFLGSNGLILNHEGSAVRRGDWGGARELEPTLTLPLARRQFQHQRLRVLVRT